MLAADRVGKCLSVVCQEVQEDRTGCIHSQKGGSQRGVNVDVRLQCAIARCWSEQVGERGEGRDPEARDEGEDVLQ
jgi:hypothetical protein